MMLSLTNRQLKLAVVFSVGTAVGLLARGWLPGQSDAGSQASGNRPAVSGNQVNAAHSLVGHCEADDELNTAGEVLLEADTEITEPSDAGALTTLDQDNIPANNEVDVLDGSAQTPVARLIDEYLSQLDPAADDAYVADVTPQLAQLIEQDGTLFANLLERYGQTPQGPEREHMRLLLTNVGYMANEVVVAELRDFALNLSDSPYPEERTEGLEILSIMDSGSDPVLRRRFLEAGRTENAPTALMAAASGLNPTLVPPTERDEIVTLLSEMARSNANVEVRASAIYQLGEWERGETFEIAVTQALNDSEPAVRTAGIQALATQDTLSPGQRSQLLEMAQKPEENSVVRVSAAEALSRLRLSEEEYQVVASILSEGNNIIE